MAGQEASPGAHFAKTNKRESTLTRNSSYRGNTATGYKRGSWQAHHIICEHALGSRSFSDDETKGFAEQCLWVSKWDLNDSDNMVGMPIRGDFRREDGIKDQNICSHANDHNTSGGYTDECKDFMQTNVWNQIKKGKNGHTTTPAGVEGALKASTAYFKAELIRRASTRAGGTIVAWTQRHDPSMASSWYEPFSMANDGAVVPRLPGAPSNIADKMVGLFQRITP